MAAESAKRKAVDPDETDTDEEGQHEAARQEEARKKHKMDPLLASAKDMKLATESLRVMSNDLFSDLRIR